LKPGILLMRAVPALGAATLAKAQFLSHLQHGTQHVFVPEAAGAHAAAAASKLKRQHDKK
jgi:hypothetical protein